FSSFKPGSPDTVKVSVEGDYIPSDQFLYDTVSEQGCGGFVKDTVIASKPLKARLAAFIHFPTGSVPYQRILTFDLYSSSALTLGSFFLLRPNETRTFPYAHGTFYISDDSIYIAKSGLLNVTAIDTCARQMAGRFSCVFTDVSDTTNQIRL